MKASLILLGLVAFASANTYDGFQVLTVRPQTTEDADLIHRAVNNLGLDQWTRPKALGAPVDIMMTDRQANSFMNILRSKNIPAEVKIADIQKVIDEQATARENRPKSSRAFDHTDYHTLNEIYATLDGLKSDFPSLVTDYVAGTTYEGRDIRVTVISSDGSNTRDVIWIDCGIHAREWVSTATCQWILDQLTSGYGSDSEVTALLDTYDFHIMTVTNPDGYEYTWNSDRLWRKNRVPYGGLGCHGTDPNRNFDSAFGGPGTSDSPCSDIYHGPSAFSEAESSAVRDSTVALGSRMKMFITIHSYSQYWMTPYGYDYTLPANYDEQYRVAETGVQALTAVHGTQFTYGNIADVIYLAAGGSSDWAYDATGVQYAFALELRDTGFWGFLLPPEQIIPTGEETWAGLKAAITAMQ
ncbi:hypothetical protein SK128_011598 [Halocaridina rubra]|uniref:Zinc carboxypeptidase A 1 n=1 Tax=Halocaridina rubra TaxID=373956 RepID=A0AAN8X5X0_HALRR